jgi:hypothetical protein
MQVTNPFAEKTVSQLS